MLPPIVSRKDAKSQGALYYFTGLPCKHGHLAPRFTSNAHCTECHRRHEKSDRAKVRRAEYGPKWHAQNRSAIIERKAQWYAANRERVLARQSAFHKANPDRGRLTASIRRARKRSAMPAWANAEAIRRFYSECPDGYHVDHIVPLAGVTPDGLPVCGLHCEANLRYLPASMNMSRQNRMTVQELALVEGRA